MRSAMRGLVRGVGLGVVPAALLLGTVAGCSAEPEAARPAGRTASAKGGDDAEGGKAGGAQGAEKGGSVGGSGSPCALPVTFDLAASWEPEAVDTALGALKQGPVTLVCEIDAKPAGNIGFMRVWTGGKRGDDARKALEAFVAAESKSREQEKYGETKAGEFAAAEVSYLNTDDALDAPKKERALAFTTPKGVVLLHLGGLDTQEHEQMLPAYELAKKSMSGS
ncbi:lipoprotein [Streptomyces sp. NPDC002889]|uniref:lipoprotein n=1 Tax=Streptomyces sp. NPDC002889 TaxID=3364669 RepID=UPI003682914C